ncbi:Chitin synthase 1 [Vanrija pseudolonga]|uniref:chitin synthase n=1 Tax=Vanrija pseudolonga TaxID=143232 RepID=A0AAF0YDL8_9TREE|nr:Chitin synthase 1 [Vanrija pseudolonga]
MARYGEVPPLPYSSGPAPQRQPTRSGGTMKRSKTLTRPERHVAPVPLINPVAQTAGVNAGDPGVDWWRITSWIVTFWAPGPLLAACGIKEKSSQQAWREKITLCFIAIVMGGFVGFFTMGLQRTLCPGGASNAAFIIVGSREGTLSVNGWMFDISDSKPPSEQVDFFTLASNNTAKGGMPGQDITLLFTRTAKDYPACTSSDKYASTPLCPPATQGAAANATSCAITQPLTQQTLDTFQMKNTSTFAGYSWDQVAALDSFVVIDGLVLNMIPYLQANPKPTGDDVDKVIRQAITNQAGSGKDITRQMNYSANLKAAIPCLTTRYLAGHIDKITPGCFVANLFLYASLIVILAVVLARFFMAIIFSWFISWRLASKPKNVGGAGISPMVMPEGANVSVNNPNGTAPWAGGPQNNKLRKDGSSPPNGAIAPVMSLSRIGHELFTVCLVTCYSEGEEGIRNTLESIASTTYPNSRKLLFIVCDGMITGAGEKMSTPDICVSMLDADPRFGNPQPMGYIAVGQGSKRENRAMVYAGHYVTQAGGRCPTVVVVKCGMPSEASDKKPGNRGKRDSQLILMNFFSRVTYNDRMCPLDFDLFRKLHTLMGVTPDFFELCLMVDADTKVFPDSMTYLVNCMAKDNMIMGACGETRIANKRQSWVTAIQVYEYFISHHHIKAFESVFGGVTCLPGCFSMYRIKARKDGDDDWVPILVKPEIVREYSQSDVHTLHQKNLLLLGEDRFLSTILLRTFPNRHNVFLPQARCRTIAPDTFSVLLSQRRRWINSTVHNLMELVLVRNLCGTFCFSMQFVVFMDLVGTVVLPIAITLTGALIINSCITPPKSFSEAIPLMLLAAVLGLPAFLILITTRKVVYVFWMFAYLLALPVWNFILPVYSFWHFDDFSWGETRKVAGEVVDKSGHGESDKAAVFDGTTIPLRRWEDWERSRLRKIRREEKRRRQMEKMHGAGFYGENGGAELMVPPREFGRNDYDSDAGSIMSSEEDVWGGDIGGYNEYHPSYPPPPTTLAPETLQAAPVVGMDEMAAILDQGFEEPPPQAAWRAERNAASPLHRTNNQFAPGAPGGPGYGGRSTPPTPPQSSDQYHDASTPIRGAYAAVPGGSPTTHDSISTGVDARGALGHAKKRSVSGVAHPLAEDHGGYGSPAQRAHRI